MIQNEKKDSGEKVDRNKKWIKTATPDEEWLDLLKDFEKLKLTPTTVPWNKYVISCFGPTSSGKSKKKKT